MKMFLLSTKILKSTEKMHLDLTSSFLQSEIDSDVNLRSYRALNKLS